MKSKLLITCLLSAAFAFNANAASTPKKKKKHTPQGLYLTAKETFAKMKTTGKKVLFLDVRTRAEVNFLGMPRIVDANVPYSMLKGDIDNRFTWNKKKKVFKLGINNNFTAEVARRLKEKGLKKTDPVILMCRSGSRSAKAAKLLFKSGYRNVYSVVDGYEGGKAKSGPRKGQRVVNGWKNAGLPWSYKLNPKKMYNAAM